MVALGKSEVGLTWWASIKTPTVTAIFKDNCAEEFVNLDVSVLRAADIFEQQGRHKNTYDHGSETSGAEVENNVFLYMCDHISPDTMIPCLLSFRDKEHF